MNIKRAAASSAAAALVVLFAGAVPASAEVANANAACPGLGISDHAVAGGPGAVAVIINEVKAAADDRGFDNSGQVVSRLAKVHPGTHIPGCENAVREILVAGP